MQAAEDEKGMNAPVKLYRCNENIMIFHATSVVYWPPSSRPGLNANVT